MLVTEHYVLHALPAMPRKPFSLVCPYCGHVHSQTCQRMLCAIVIIFMIPLLFFASGIFASGTHLRKANQLEGPVGFKRELRTISHPSIVVLPSTSAPADNTILLTALTLTPTPLPIPTTGVIWNPPGTGVYFWEAPGRGPIIYLPNGAVVLFLDEWQPYGGLAWARVALDKQVGWVDATRILRVNLPESGLMVVKDSGGYLYTEPDGKPTIWLSPSTPIQIESEIDETAQLEWVQISISNGQQGWVQRNLLTTIYLQSP